VVEIYRSQGEGWLALAVLLLPLLWLLYTDLLQESVLNGFIKDLPLACHGGFIILPRQEADRKLKSSGAPLANPVRASLGIAAQYIFEKHVHIQADTKVVAEQLAIGHTFDVNLNVCTKAGHERRTRAVDMLTESVLVH
jgi:hypothetical protein